MENGKSIVVVPDPPPAMLTGGYDIGGAKLFNKHGEVTETAALKCSKCSLLLKEPRQVITCGHRYCKLCIEQLINGGNEPYLCLVDKETFTLAEVRNDKGCLRDILALEVTCPTISPCSWKGKLTDMENHVSACPNTEVVCDLGCGKHFKRGNLSTHHSECPKRPSKCNYCHENIPLDSIQVHYGVCQEYPVTCDFCKKDVPTRKKLTDHLEQDCDEFYMDCIHDGCSFKGRKSDMTQHVLSKHLIQSLERMVGMEKRLIVLESENKTFCEELTECRTTVSDLQLQTNKLVQENKQKDVVIESLKSIIERLEKENDEKFLGLIEGRNAGDTVDRDGPKKEIIKAVAQGRSTPKYKVKSLAPQPDLFPAKTKYRVSEDKAVKSLNPQIEPLYSVTGTVPDIEFNLIKQDVDMMQSKIRQLNDVVQASQDNQTRYSIAMDEVRLRQDVLDVKTTNGTLIWKIPDIRRRYRDAVDRRTISLYSPPFYTSPHGYRMCIRTYLNGDGIGKGTHLSLFFVMMRSEQDNLLPWSFKQSVRFTLINQKNPAASITEAFVPDLNSPSFQKPENDMNIASGFPKFSRQSVLQDDDYIMGNMIYIKCQVDLTGLTAQ